MANKLVKSSIFILCSLTISLTFLGCGEPPTSLDNSPDYGKISGKVMDTSRGGPVEGVKIITDPPTSTVTTDSSGIYVISNVKPGDYTITALKNDYTVGRTDVVRVKEDEVATGDIDISSTDITVYLVADPPIIGRGETTTIASDVRGAVKVGDVIQDQNGNIVNVDAVTSAHYWSEYNNKGTMSVTYGPTSERSVKWTAPMDSDKNIYVIVAVVTENITSIKGNQNTETIKVGSGVVKILVRN
jgi:hypothetical protein